MFSFPLFVCRLISVNKVFTLQDWVSAVQRLWFTAVNLPERHHFCWGQTNIWLSTGRLSEPGLAPALQIQIQRTLLIPQRAIHMYLTNIHEKHTEYSAWQHTCFSDKQHQGQAMDSLWIGCLCCKKNPIWNSHWRWEVWQRWGKRFEVTGIPS